MAVTARQDDTSPRIAEDYGSFSPLLSALGLGLGLPSANKMSPMKDVFPRPVQPSSRLFIQYIYICINTQNIRGSKCIRTYNANAILCRKSVSFQLAARKRANGFR